MGIPIFYDKPFKTYDEQIEHLANEYGLDIPDTEFAKYVLSTFSYYDIINGYQECMMENGKFQKGLSLDFLYFFHKFDKEFQNIIFKNSLLIENSFKTKLAYALSEHYGVDMFDYLNQANYKFIYKGNLTYFKLRKDITKDISVTNYKTQKTTYPKQPTKHYAECHNHIPPWILLKNISFEHAINLYCLSKPTIKNDVSNEILPYDIKTKDKISFLTSALNLIRKFRNVIAHNLKFVTYSQEKSKLPFNTTKELLNEPNTTDGIKSFDDLYACIIALFILLNDPKEQMALVCDIQNLFSKPMYNLPNFIPIQRLIISHYCSITNLDDKFPNRLAGLIRVSIKYSKISDELKEKYLSMCKIPIS